MEHNVTNRPKQVSRIAHEPAGGGSKAYVDLVLRKHFPAKCSLRSHNIQFAVTFDVEVC